MPILLPPTLIFFFEGFFGDSAGFARLDILSPNHPGIKFLKQSKKNQEMGKKTTEQTTNNCTFNFLFIEIDAHQYF